MLFLIYKKTENKLSHRTEIELNTFPPCQCFRQIELVALCSYCFTVGVFIHATYTTVYFMTSANIHMTVIMSFVMKLLFVVQSYDGGIGQGSGLESHGELNL